MYDHYNRVQKFDINGVYSLQFKNQQSGNGVLNAPFGIAVHDNKVYVADVVNHYISVFQLDSQFCKTIGSGKLRDPCSVTVTTNGQLLVTDFK